MKRRKKTLSKESVPHMDVLQNIETGIMRAYQNSPELTDFEVKKAIEALERHYKAIERGRRPPNIRLADRSTQVRDFVQAICDWRLGKEIGGDLRTVNDPISTDIVVKCLRRIKKSIDFWTQNSGRQGYLNYVQNFIK